MPAGGEPGVGDPGLHLGEVLPGAEGAACPGDHHNGHLRVGGGVGQGVGGGVIERLIEGVERLGAVEGEGANPVVVCGEHPMCGGVRHRYPS